MANLVLKVATADQLYEADVHTYSSWGAPHLSLAQYLEREARLRDTAFAKETLTGYVLVPAADPDTRDILAYVEVFRRPSVVYPASASPKVYVDGFSIGSVYTPVAHRKKGYATTMLALVVAQLRAASTSFVLSNLYSDIGPTYYATKGWRVHRSDEATIPVAAIVPPAASPASAVLYSIDSPSALVHAAQGSQRLLDASLRPGQCAFVVTASCIEWFAARSHFYGHTLKHLSSLPSLLGGYKVGANGKVTDAVLWTHNFRDDQLVLLHWNVQAENAWAFLSLAAKEAAAWQLKSIVVWNAELPTELRAYNKARDDSLASLLVQTLPDATEVALEWIGNEKYAWV
ncbi:hypothetical protein SPRG_01351 [Saprolegnia parasitica CBS 223.65]|uniref:LYC1 C-terminal domain-containing protein n=1 Tax=Saprolegnia parasitica (strain CBS 223.65) TaxID=695850 RepID=A0A067D4Z4_SAPPC|nr:hypothetical protein SPRG_01351 [Saprolegnia parasitica CBS 223.65]KDO34077.1 hypothetical protein SPRG_01351 [Saprolegnia parasitica CBS 223.65]|eukprot:XP_012194961.1 hypothetical protein SPRG_01351 [Saprolegnia parasitica CBS 223.65]